MLSLYLFYRKVLLYMSGLLASIEITWKAKQVFENEKSLFLLKISTKHFKNEWWKRKLQPVLMTFIILIVTWEIFYINIMEDLEVAKQIKLFYFSWKLIFLYLQCKQKVQSDTQGRAQMHHLT